MTKGITFPLEISNGTLAVASDEDLYKGHILTWLKTEVYERVMRQKYGLEDYLFQGVSDITRIASDIKAGLEEYVPDVKFEVEGKINDAGEAEYNIYWAYDDGSQTIFRLVL